MKLETDRGDTLTSTSIIGRSDGPTSVFIGGTSRNLPFKFRLKNYIYRRRRMIASKEIVAGSHTLEELVLYAQKTYHATEVKTKSDETSCLSRIYEIKIGNRCLDIEIDDKRETFGVSFSGSKKQMKVFQKIAKDLYLYYGCSENDIASKSERYLSLLSVLSM